MPAEATNVLILSDLHIPFHDPEAIEQAVRWGKVHEVNTVVLNGDTVDCYQLSRFIKDARYPRLEEEIGAVSEFLDYLRAEFPDALIVWKNGNHDERLEAWMKVKNPELLNVLSWQYNDLPQLRRHFEDRMVYVTDKRKVMAGKLTILHGHEFQSKATGQVNPARSLFLKTYQSAMVGHHHITSEHTDKKLDNEIITCWSVGCLCGLWPEYARINRWNHGFARVKVATDGTFKVANIRIIDGKIY
jgi:predicted phosphodiesterase